MTQIAMRRFPRLTVSAPRLHVGGLAEHDAAAVAEILSDRQTLRWGPFAPDFGLPDALAWCTEQAVERRDSGAGDHYGMVRREDDRLVGCLWTKRTDWAAMATEVGFAVAPHARGFGLAAEALDVLSVALLLEHGFHRVEVRVAPGNDAARRVVEKAGFSFEGLLRDAGYTSSGRVDLQVWSLVAADLR
ncbi:GNAT family protein [Pilimelia columellifera]|uniref:N-acetyltransferase domain-containing protein n=1 Tax=Pilimelia columellifera subsp. columellifera TaxID=706583 RepID=A0ABN3NSL5_9ACTN